MELRILHTVAYQTTWYGKWGYSFGRGGYNIQPEQWAAAAASAHDVSLDDLLADFKGRDDAMAAVIMRYRTSKVPFPLAFRL
jgi:hypothetical protein